MLQTPTHANASLANDTIYHGYYCNSTPKLAERASFSSDNTTPRAFLIAFVARKLLNGQLFPRHSWGRVALEGGQQTPRGVGTQSQNNEQSLLVV